MAKANNKTIKGNADEAYLKINVNKLKLSKLVVDIKSIGKIACSKQNISIGFNSFEGRTTSLIQI